MARLDLVRDLVTFSSQHEHIGSSIAGPSVDGSGGHPPARAGSRITRARQGGAFLSGGGRHGDLRRNRTFLVGAVLILVVGALLFGGVIAVRVMAEARRHAGAGGDPARLVQQRQQLRHDRLRAAHASTPTAETPEFITKRLEEQRGIVLLVYVEGAADDMEMLSLLQRRQGASTPPTARSSPSRRASPSELGDLLAQLRVSDPPILAIIRGDGTGRPALHRLDRPQGHGAGRRRRRARPLTAGTGARLQTAPSRGAVSV